MWSCSSAAAPLVTRWASRRAPRPTVLRSRRWGWLVTRDGISGTKVRTFSSRRPGTARPCERRSMSGARSPSTTRAPTRRTSCPRRPPRPDAGAPYETHARYVFLSSRPHRRAGSQPGGVLPPERLGGLDRVHGRSSSAQFVLGNVRDADVRHPGCCRHTDRAACLPADIPGPLHQVERVRLDSRPRVVAALVHCRSPGEGTGVPPRAAGRTGPIRALHDAFLLYRPSGRRTLPDELLDP